MLSIELDSLHVVVLVQQYICDAAVFSLDRHVQLTRCFSAVAELLISFTV